jgi:hypothetical protein
MKVWDRGVGPPWTCGTLFMSLDRGCHLFELERSDEPKSQVTIPECDHFIEWKEDDNRFKCRDYRIYYKGFRQAELDHQRVRLANDTLATITGSL